MEGSMKKLGKSSLPSHRCFVFKRLGGCQPINKFSFHFYLLLKQKKTDSVLFFIANNVCWPVSIQY